jgi:hypothetical protein
MKEMNSEVLGETLLEVYQMNSIEEDGRTSVGMK